MRNKIFVCFLAVLFLIGLSTFFFQKETSSLERKYLVVNEDLRETSINEMSFQRKFEQMIVDQLPFKKEFIQSFYNSKRLINFPIINGIVKMKEDLLYLSDWEGYIKDFPAADSEMEKMAANHGYNINHVAEQFPEVKFYVYQPLRLEETGLLNYFGVESFGPNYQLLFLQQMSDRVKYRSLSIESVDDYFNLYYHTDLHWNIVGAYQGYSDLISMLQEDFEIQSAKTVEKKVCFPQKFYGNLANQLGQTTSYDHLCDLELSDINPYELYVNGIYVEEYKKELYAEGFKEEAFSDYDYYYGSNELERVYHFEGNEDKPNVLMFVDSFSNPIRTWVASHFNTTILMDLRSLENREQFDLAAIIEENEIDAIIILMYYDNLYFNGDSFIPLKEE